jgi:hypothetical protein
MARGFACLCARTGLPTASSRGGCRLQWRRTCASRLCHRGCSPKRIKAITQRSPIGRRPVSVSPRTFCTMPVSVVELAEHGTSLARSLTRADIRKVRDGSRYQSHLRHFVPYSCHRAKHHITLVLGRELLSIARYLAWRLANGRCNNEELIAKTAMTGGVL